MTTRQHSVLRIGGNSSSQDESTGGESASRRIRASGKQPARLSVFFASAIL